MNVHGLSPEDRAASQTPQSPVSAREQPIETLQLERVAQVFGSALDDCLTVPLSGLARHGREAREIGRLFAIDGSDHWHSLPGSDLPGRSCAGRSVRRRP